MVTRIIPTKKGRKIIERLKKNSKLGKMDNKFFGSKDHPIKQLEEAYKKYLPENPPKDFQHPFGSTIVIYDERNREIFRCKGSIRKKELEALSDRFPKATVLVDVGSGISKQIPIKTFKKLIKIKFIIFERDYEFFGIDEFEPTSKSGDWFAPDNVIDYIYSINQMLKLFIIEEAFDKANAVYLAAKFYHLTGSEKTCKILYQSGKSDNIKFKKFLEKYNLNFEIGLYESKKKRIKDRL